MNQRKRMRQRVVAGLNNPFVMLPATRRPELLHLMGEEKDEIDCKIDLKKTKQNTIALFGRCITACSHVSYWLDCWMREEQKVTDRLDP